MTRMSQKKFVMTIFFFVFILIGIQTVQAQSASYSMRELMIDTYGKTIYLNENSANMDGSLIETVDGRQIKSWKIKYEQKGSSRSQCKPPVLNISFDKKDSKGRAKELFTGVSTFDNYSQLQYQKIRMIPECDVWNDYGIHVSDIGFNGKLNVNFREYIIFKIFRMFGIPTADIIGFANVTFVTPDHGYSSGTFRYMIVQRPSEQDDQIPFSRQYNLDPNYYESGDFEGGNRTWDLENREFNPLVSARIVHNDGTKVDINFNKETVIKYKLFSEFLNLSDMAPLHNEDWAIDLATRETQIIPHGFDASLSCDLFRPGSLQLIRLVNDLPDNIRSEYQSSLYTIAKDIFGTEKSLASMLEAVSAFPYNTDKDLLNNFLKLQFYRYAKYIKSQEFANELRQQYIEEPSFLPFTEEEYNLRLNNFNQACSKMREGVDSNIRIISKPTIVTNAGDPLPLSFEFEVSTKDLPLDLLKSDFYLSALNAKLVDNVSKKEQPITIRYVSTSSIVQDVAGPYYRIPPHSKAIFKAWASIQSNEYINSDYYVIINNFKPNSFTNEFDLNIKSNLINMGRLKPIGVVSPIPSQKLQLNSDLLISWTGSDNNSYDFYVTQAGNDWFRYQIRFPTLLDDKEKKEFRWKVGEIFQWKWETTKWNTEMLPPGQYTFHIYYNNYSNDRYETTVDFEIVDDGNNRGSLTSIIGVPSFEVIYDKFQREAMLLAKFKVRIDPGDYDQFLPRNNAFIARLVDINMNGSYGFQKYDGYPSLEVYDDTTYIIRAGTPTVIDLEFTYDPSNIFSGIYKVVLDGVAFRNFGNYKIVHLDKGVTNELNVIGERSPYIHSVEKGEVAANEEIIVRGIRFSTTTENIVTLKSVYFCPEGYTCGQNRTYKVKSTDAKSISFVSNILPGEYLLQVSLPDTGASNIVSIKISTSTQSQTLKSSKQKAISGETVALNFTALPGLLNSKLRISCPTNIIITENSKNICNQFVTREKSSEQINIKLVNNASYPQHILPTIYAYYNGDPDFATISSTAILILPAVATTTITLSPKTTPPITGTSSVARTALLVTKDLIDQAIVKIDKVLSSTPSPSPSVRPASSVTPSVSPRVSPSILPTVRISPSVTPTASITPTPSSSVSTKPSVSASPRPSPTPSPSPSPSITPTVTPSPLPSSSPSPTTAAASPVATPSPSQSPTATPTPTPTPSATPISTPSPSPTVTATPSPSIQPSPSSSPSAFSTARFSASIINSFLRLFLHK